MLSLVTDIANVFFAEMTSEHVVSTVLENVDGITDLAQRALKIKDEANQFFNGTFAPFYICASEKLNFWPYICCIEGFT